MAIVLTAAISVPNVQRAVLLRPPQLFDNSSMMTFEVRSAAGGGRTRIFEVWARNSVDGKCDVLGVNPTPVSFDDDVRVVKGSLASATSADQIEAAYRTGSTKALALKAVEQKCIDLGVVTLVGTVQ